MMMIRKQLASLHTDEAGEGVISAAIAVLITAFLGAAMWGIFNQMMNTTADSTCAQVAKIGGADSAQNCDE